MKFKNTNLSYFLKSMLQEILFKRINIKKRFN